MILERKISTIDIFYKNELVASIVTESPVDSSGSNEAGMHITIGEESVIIAAEKVEIR